MKEFGTTYGPVVFSCIGFPHKNIVCTLLFAFLLYCALLRDYYCLFDWIGHFCSCNNIKGLHCHFSQHSGIRTWFIFLG